MMIVTVTVTATVTETATAIPVSDKYTLILLVVSVGLTPSLLMSMFTDMANVTLRVHPIPLNRVLVPALQTITKLNLCACSAARVVISFASSDMLKCR